MKFAIALAVLEFFAIMVLFKNKIGFEWLASTMSGADGTSAKRLTAFTFVVFTGCLHAGYLYIGLTIDPHQLPDFPYVLGIDLLFILLLFAVITAQNVIEAVKNVKGKPDGNPTQDIPT